ncbi:L,D-transpeptidase [Streptomyces odonnellii]|uniref:L,D-transpeptidase n=1 Tax=Streptomyces odonnellii TaxID=1417980 RepID=UPI0006268D94|nr:L,D-transpeptidase [Streptomyces odonnellii]
MISGVRTGRPARSTGRPARVRSAVAVCAAAAAVALALTGCSAQAGTGGTNGANSTNGSAGDTEGTADQKQPAVADPAARRANTQAKPTPSATPSAAPEPAVLKNVRINVADGQTVDVGMPISLTFDQPVPDTERAAVERLLAVSTSTGVTGSWSWVKDRNLLDGQRIDYRPRQFWAPGTKVTVRAGSGVTRNFKIGRSLVAIVDVRTHTMTVDKDGTTRQIPITAGAPGMDTWNGTMVVSDKQRRVLMDSRTVGYGDAYKGYYSYAVHLTTSGTYLHQNPKADTYAGRQNVTHGCIGLATDGTARRFYEEVIPGDVVRVTGSTETVAAGNGYGDWNLDWEEWRAGSALR